MKLVRRVRSMIGEGTTDKRYAYKCGACGIGFEAPVPNPNDTACPDCGSDRVHSAV